MFTDTFQCWLHIWKYQNTADRLKDQKGSDEVEHPKLNNKYYYWSNLSQTLTWQYEFALIPNMFCKYRMFLGLWTLFHTVQVVVEPPEIPSSRFWSAQKKTNQQTSFMLSSGRCLSKRVCILKITFWKITKENEPFVIVSYPTQWSLL